MFADEPKYSVFQKLIGRNSESDELRTDEDEINSSDAITKLSEKYPVGKPTWTKANSRPMWMKMNGPSTVR